MSLIVEVAEAVESEIDGASLSQTPDSVVFSYYPDQKLKDVGTDLIVNVVPSDLIEERGNRNQIRSEVRVMVSVEKKLEGRTNALINPMVEYSEEIRGLLRKRLTTTSGLDCIWTETEVIDLVNFEAMKQLGTFASLTKFTYRVLSS